MTDKKRECQQNYMGRKAKRGYVLKQLFIHESILDAVKRMIRKSHINVEIDALLAEQKQETPTALEIQPA